MSHAACLTPPRMTKSAAARALGVHEKTIERLIEIGELKAIPRIGGIRAVVLTSGVEALAARMSGDNAG